MLFSPVKLHYEQFSFSQVRNVIDLSAFSSLLICNSAKFSTELAKFSMTPLSSG